MKEHAAGLSAFTRRYNVHKLIYVEEYSVIRDAIAREKQIKSWLTPGIRCGKICRTESSDFRCDGKGVELDGERCYKTAAS